MSRVHIGEKGGRIGAWISAPGNDASSEGGRMLLNSDFDNLKHHYSDRRAITGGDLAPQGFYYGASLADPVFSFPPLPFVPLAFMATARQITNYTVSFPPMSNYNPSGPGGITFIGTPKFTVYNNRVVVENQFEIWDTQAWCYVWVFANTIEGL